MHSCDALIVGGGPAGSTCAWELRRAGLDVLVLDRAPFPRDKPCAGWITPQVLEALELTAEEYGRGRVIQPITALRTGRIGEAPIETRYAGTVSFGIRRCEFDNFLLSRSGARVRTGAPVTQIRRDGAGWVVNDEIRAPLLIGAGGHFCPVARFLGGGGGAEPIVAAQEVELRMTGAQLSQCAAAGEEPELYFCADWKGYGWIFRKGDYLNVGFGRQDTRGLSAHTSAFVAWLGEQGRIPSHLSGRWRGHAYLLWESTPRPLVGDGVLLAGDAAGLAYSPSGEGIRPAVESGLLAARTVLAAGGRYRRQDLEPYREAVAARLGRRGTFAPLLAPLLRVVPAGLARRLGARLLASPTWTRRVLLDRWFLRAHQPAMASAAAPAPERRAVNC